MNIIKHCPFCGTPQENGYLSIEPRTNHLGFVVEYIICGSCGSAAPRSLWNLRFDEATNAVHLEHDEFWALWRDLTERARVLNETAAIFRLQAKWRTDCHGSGVLGWQSKLKTAITRERQARHLLERAAMFKRIYEEMKK